MQYIYVPFLLRIKKISGICFLCLVFFLAFIVSFGYAEPNHPRICTKQIPPAVAGIPYRTYFTYSSTELKTRFVLEKGKLPPGIEWHGGSIDGTPKHAGTWKFVVRLYDELNRFDTAEYTLVIYASIAESGFKRLAQDRIDFYRDETHRDKMRVILPDDSPEPGDYAEVYLINGYISYTCTRFVWQKGNVHADRICIKRTWFYNPEGESVVSKRLDIEPGLFIKAWKAYRLIRESRAVKKYPKPPMPSEEAIAESSKGVRRGGGSISMSLSSHEPYYLIMSHRGKTKSPDYFEKVRGTRKKDGIRVYKEIQARAVFSCFDELTAGKQGKELPVKEWGPYMTRHIQYAAFQDAPKYRDPLPLLAETSLRVLGGAAFSKSIPVIMDFRDTVSSTYMDADMLECMLRESDYALTRITLETAWDPDDAIKVIHENPGRYHADNDLTQWIRTFFYNRDSSSYFNMLIDDMTAHRENVSLLRDTMHELHKHYTGKAVSRIKELLDHPDPQVAADAAIIVLENLPDSGDAYRILDRLASDTHTEIGELTEWHHDFARKRALEHLVNPEVPEKFRWDENRIQDQLAKKNEDGRMVRNLISQLSILQKKEMSRDKQIAAYRKVLNGKLNRGILAAVDMLMQLKDKQSYGKISILLNVLEQGCKQTLTWKPDPEAQYTWISTYDIDLYRGKLQKAKAAGLKVSD